MFNDWRRPGTASVVWLENDGRQNFTPRQIADRPTHLATVACGDLNGDGRADIVAGSLHSWSRSTGSDGSPSGSAEGDAVTRLLAFVVVVELVVGATLVLGRWQQAVPPVPDLSLVDSLAAEQLAEQARACHTPADWRALGEACMAVGYFPEAEACHRVAAEREPANPTFVYEWAFALERLGRTADAAEQFGRAADLGHPRPADCRYNVARCRLREEDVAAARAAFEDARTVPMARYELARLSYREGDIDGARRELDPLLAEFPHAIQPAVLRHRIAHQQGDDRLAFQFADLADRARGRLPNPFDADSERLIAAHKKIGVKARWAEVETLVQKGELDLAVPIITQAAEVQWHPAGADVMAEVLLRSGDSHGALEQFQVIESRTGPAFPHLARLGDTLAEIGKNEAARAAWTRAVAIGSLLESKDVHYKLAESYRKAGDQQKADKHMVQALIAAGVEQQRRGAVNDARGLFREALLVDPKSAAAWFRLGELARQTGQQSEAVRAYEECLARDPNHGRAAAALAAARGSDFGPGTNLLVGAEGEEGPSTRWVVGRARRPVSCIYRNLLPPFPPARSPTHRIVARP